MRSITTRSVFLILCFLWVILPGVLPPLGERGGTIAISDFLGIITLVFCGLLFLTQRFRMSLAHAALITHLVAVLVSCILFFGDSFFSQSLGRAIRFFCIVSPALLFLFFSLSRDELVSLIKTYLWSSIIGISLPLYAYAIGSSSAQAVQTIDLDFVGVVRRAGGWVGDSSAFGHQLSSVGSLLLLCFASGILRLRVLGLILIIIVSYGLYATSSRSAFLSIVISLAACYFFGRYSLVQKLGKFLGLIVAIFVLTSVAFYFGIFNLIDGLDVVVERLLGPFNALFTPNSASVISAGRTDNWVRMFNELGWGLIVGVGYGSLALLHGIADNIFIKALGETGVIGFVSLILLFFALFARFWRLRNSPMHSCALFFLLGQLVSSLLVDTFTFYSSIPSVFAILFAIYCFKPERVAVSGHVDQAQYS